jgi:hypothetical protein
MSVREDESNTMDSQQEVQVRIAERGILKLVELLDFGYRRRIPPMRIMSDAPLVCPSSISSFQIPEKEIIAGPSRILGECVNTKCAYYETYCSLGVMVAEASKWAVAKGLHVRSACSLKDECRWYSENGLSACQLCPHIVRRYKKPEEAR